MNKEDYHLGDWITVNSTLRRVHISNSAARAAAEHPNRINRKWERREIRTVGAMVIGIRTLSNGWVEYYPEEGHSYGIVETFPALLVVTSIYSKPFYTIP